MKMDKEHVMQSKQENYVLNMFYLAIHFQRLLGNFTEILCKFLEVYVDQW